MPTVFCYLSLLLGYVNIAWGSCHHDMNFFLAGTLAYHPHNEFSTVFSWTLYICQIILVSWNIKPVSYHKGMSDLGVHSSSFSIYSDLSHMSGNSVLLLVCTHLTFSSNNIGSSSFCSWTLGPTVSDEHLTLSLADSVLLPPLQWLPPAYLQGL
jgi:hypothetical protein